MFSNEYENPRMIGMVRNHRNAGRIPIFDVGEMRPAFTRYCDFDSICQDERSTAFLAIKYVLAHLSIRLTIKDLADALPVSKRSLERHVRDELGVSARRMVTLIRMEAARQSLIRSDQPITLIAVDAGFASASSMCNVFRRELGKTPSQIRDESQAKPDHGKANLSQ